MPAVLLHGLVPRETLHRATAPEHEMIEYNAFKVLVSPAPLGLDDLPPDALAELALRHNAILLNYCADGPVLPLRFGTAFSSATVALAHLRPLAEWHLRALKATGTFREFAIRLTLQGDPPELALTEPRSGRDFLNRGRLVRDHRRTLNENRAALARQLLSDLRELTWQIRPAGASKPERLLDATLLLPPQNMPALSTLTMGRAAAATALGLDLRLSGPWPAYSFDPENPPVPEVTHGA